MPSHTLVCRLCRTPLGDPVIDLGSTPLANGYLRQADLLAPQLSYPLRAFLCGHCGLLQLAAKASPADIFSDYAYFSSVSQTLLDHSKRFAGDMIDRLELAPGDKVVEVASNDGYLLQFFKAHGLDVLGVEPAGNVAAVARERGIPTLTRFFGADAATEVEREHGRPRLLVANNVLAHVPDLRDFLAGLETLLAPDAMLTLEFHHLLCLVEKAQFDNIYHEHYQYLSLRAAICALAAHSMKVVDVEQLSTQGGSLRLFVVRSNVTPQRISPRVREVLDAEDRAGLTMPDTYRPLAEKVAAIKAGLLSFLTSAKQDGKSVVCFGAAAKGNTLLNCSGVDATLVDYAVDSSTHKQGMFLPGSRLPIHDPSRIFETRPDYVLILPWNLREEITAQMAAIRDWGGQFVVAVPELRVLG